MAVFRLQNIHDNRTKNRWKYSMAFSTSVVRVMIIKSTIFLLLIHLLIIQGKSTIFIYTNVFTFVFAVTHGHLECPGDLIPCSNQTDCINIDQVCIGNHHCVDQQGHSICLYSILNILFLESFSFLKAIIVN